MDRLPANTTRFSCLRDALQAAGIPVDHVPQPIRGWQALEIFRQHGFEMHLMAEATVPFQPRPALVLYQTAALADGSAVLHAVYLPRFTAENMAVLGAVLVGGVIFLASPTEGGNA